ncbi:MAG TPA: hypothetical protein VF934_03870 [Burkholderiales bacterium]
MRRITRGPLPANTQNALNNRQTSADAKRIAGTLVIEVEWKSARQTKGLKTAASELALMAGPRERCMYCCDSHGTDIDHFWPKALYAEKMFMWSNLLLSCTECGRFKGNQFPLQGGIPMLVDPTAEDPWEFLEFDPETGIVVARFDVAADTENPKGAETVRAFQLDRREALSEGYRKTWRRLVAIIEIALMQQPIHADNLIQALRDADDHYLLGWCFAGTGQQLLPFRTLQAEHPAVWIGCRQSFL